MKLKRVATLLLACIFVFLLVIPANAKEDYTITVYNRNTISYNGATYKRYKKFDHLDRYHPEVAYYQDVEIDDGSEFLETQRIYTDEEKTMILIPDGTDPCNDKVPDIYLRSDAAEMREKGSWKEGESFVILVDGWASAAEYPVHEIKHSLTSYFPLENLEDALCYEIYAFYEDASFARCIGAIYHVGEYYWEVSYDTISDRFFDSEGHINYNTHGTVDAKRIDRESVPLLEEVLQQTMDLEVRFESDNPMSAGAIAFYVLLVLFGFLLPLAPLILGIVFALSKKTSAFKRWIVLVAFSLIWIIVAAVLLIITLL